MKKLLFLIFLTSNSLFSQRDQREFIRNSFPQLDEVLTYIQDKVKHPCQDHYYTLGKKPDGYFLYIHDFSYPETQLVDSAKIWDAGKKEFQNFKIDKYLNLFAERYSSENADLGAIWSQKSKYDFMLFYGYPNWISDTKKLLANHADLSCQDLEILSRALSEEASDYIHPNQYGSNLPATKNLNDPVYEKIEPARVKSFMELVTKSAECLQKIKTKCPDYVPLIIENLDAKIAYDQMHVYSYLLSVKEDDLAKQQLSKIKFPDEALNYGRALLKSCTANSFIITNGDSDTYPIMYLQEKENFRKDVILLNASLMQTPWYLTMTLEKYKPKSQLTKEDYKLLKTLNLYQIDYTESKDTLYATWLKQKMDSIRSFPELAIYQSFYTFTPENLYLEINDQALKLNFRGTPNLFEISLMDFISANPEKHFFTSSPFTFYKLNLIKNCPYRGLASQLVPSVHDDYMDALSVRQLEGLIEDLKLTQLEKSNFLKMYNLGLLFAQLNLLPDSSSQEVERLFKLINAQITYPKLISFDNPYLLYSYAKVCRKADPDLFRNFQQGLAPVVKLKVEQLDPKKPAFYAEVLDLENLLKIYLQEYDFMNEQAITTTEKDIIQCYYDKYQKLNGNFANLSYSMKLFKEVFSASKVIENR